MTIIKDLMRNILSDISPPVILLAYILIVTFTPNFQALDTASTRFVSLSLLNIVSFTYLLASGIIIRKNPNPLALFIKNRIGLAYTALLIISLLSIFNATNIPEAVIAFSRIFSVFLAVLIIWVLLMNDLQLAKLIVAVMTGLLIIDAFWVFQQIAGFINRDINLINDITTIYSNKNILSASIFLKLPFALFLMVFERKSFPRNAGWAALFFGMLALFLLASRAFYLGLIFVTIFFLLYTFIHYLARKEKRYVRLAGMYLVALVLAFSAHHLVQRNLFPEKGRHTEPVQRQLTIIGDVVRVDSTYVRDEGSTWDRLDAWRRSLYLIGENPLLGVGVGNWKIDILKYENQENPSFIYMYNAHNDFLHHMAEKGLVGGLLYVSIFLLMLWYFWRHHRRNPDDSRLSYQVLFLAAAGLLHFSVDAFFNFPHERPVLMLYWILFISMGMAAADDTRLAAAPGKAGLGSPSLKNGVCIAVLLVLMLASSVINHMNYRSAVAQKTVVNDIMAGRLDFEENLWIGPLSTWTLPCERELTDDPMPRLPAIPNVSLWNEPVACIKARYLLAGHQYREALEVLRNDNSNPFDSRREYLMAVAYARLGMADSALVYMQQALALKPYSEHYRNFYEALNEEVSE